MAKIYIEAYDRGKHADDVSALAKVLRREDLEELEACGCKAQEALFASLDNAGIAFMVKTTKGPLCAFGLAARQDEGLGRAIWFLGSEAMENFKREFLIYSKQILECWRQEFGRLYNYVSVNNDKALRWLKWLGAVFSEPFPYGKNGELFILFTLGGI